MLDPLHLLEVLTCNVPSFPPRASLPRLIMPNTHETEAIKRRYGHIARCAPELPYVIYFGG